MNRFIRSLMCAAGVVLMLCFVAPASSATVSISSVTPKVGPTAGNNTVTVNGSGFVSGATLTFGGTAATAVKLVNANQLTATAPAHSQGAVTVTATIPGGTSGSLANGYTYSPGPIVWSISPASGPATGGTQVSLSGANLGGVTKVTFDGLAAKIVSAAAGVVKVTTPAHLSGPTDVTVVLTASNGTSTYTQEFTYNMVFSTKGLDDAYPSAEYSEPMKVLGGVAPFTWSIASGKLPSGLQLNSSSGVISGVPAATYGIYTITVQAKDSSPHPLTVVSPSFTFNVVYGFSQRAVPSTFFGMMLFDQTIWPTIPVGALGKGLATTWPFVEQTQGQYDWSVLDQYVADAQKHKVPFYWTNANFPPWAESSQSTCSTYTGGVVGCTAMISNIQYWDDFITALVTRYKGKIYMYELWNEPNISNTFSNPDGTACVSGQCMTDMVTLTTDMYNIVRSIDPNAVIASPSSTAAPWLQTYFDEGGTKGINLVAIHGYPNVLQNDVPEAIVGFKSTNIKETVAPFGLQNKAIWDTENSWGGSTGITDPQERAAFVARSLLLHWSVGIPVAYWYGWDTDWGTLWSSTSGISPAGTAYEEVESWMLGANMTTPCTQNGGTTYSATYTCDLYRSSGYWGRAVWDTTQTCNGTCSTSTYAPPSNFVQYRDLTGKVVPITPGETIQIGAKPILLENQNP